MSATPQSPIADETPPAPAVVIVSGRLAGARRGRAARATALRHRLAVRIGKRVLPVVAVAILLAVAMWPQLSGDSSHARLSYRVDTVDPRGGEIHAAIYHGVDQNGEPYMVTAEQARQTGEDRFDLTAPQADVTLKSGSWLSGRARSGVYLRKAGSLDLSSDVVLYRDDGTTLVTATATVDLKAGAAAGSDSTHAEGPFGTLDAQGFAATDRGAVIRFSGPGRFVMNTARPAAPAAAPAADPDAAPAPPKLAVAAPGPT